MPTRVQSAFIDLGEIGEETDEVTLELPGVGLGNLLVSTIGVDKSSETEPSPSEGWTRIAADVSSSVSCAMAYRIADGTALDSCTWTWSKVSWCTGVIVEYEGFPAGVRTPVVTTAYTTEVSVKEVSLPSAEADGDSLALAAIFVDTGSNWDGVSWTNGFTGFITGPGTDGDTWMAELEVEDGASISTKATTTDSGDQASGILALFGVEVSAKSKRLTLLGVG